LRYYNKLKKENIIKESTKEKHQPLIIFDWDDTLLCTSYLGIYGFLKISPDLEQSLAELDKQVAKILNLCITYGKTYIVTNAA